MCCHIIRRKKVAIVKRQCFLLLMLTALLFTHSAHAACVPADPGEGAGEVSGDFIPAPLKQPRQVYVDVPEEFADDFMQRFLYDLPSIPQEFWECWHELEWTPYHHTYSFYTSMGCEDVFCLDETHIHWCVTDICQNPDHGHSDIEYAKAAAYSPACPCHKR